jgi:exodeoxyribonuclease V alpha subunit
MSPTGKAAQVLSDKTKGDAATIHRSLKLMPGEDVGKEDVMEDIVIVDEFSMVGIDTFYALLEAMSENAWGNLVLVGDCNQLPSVSPGNFLSDMMTAQCANIVRLSHIHRQDEKSYISLIANQIAGGKNSDIPEDASDIKWIEMRPERFIEMLTQAVGKFMEKRDLKDLQIMAPKYKGSCGVDLINREIQSMMCVHNKTEAKHLKRQYKEFFIGDRVIQTVNNYDKQIFNGDMGHIVDLGRKVVDPKVSDQKEDYVVVDFYGDEIMFLSEEIDELQLAWCITVHKFQGSQSPYIIFIMGAEAQRMMYKELVYTAFTRAEKYLCIYGNINMLRRAPHESIVRERYTNIVAMMREMKENRSLLKVIE